MNHTSVRIGLFPWAFRLLLIGEILILLALFDFAARLNVAALTGAEGALLRMADIGPSLSGSIVILCCAVVGLDYWERRGEEP